MHVFGNARDMGSVGSVLGVALLAGVELPAPWACAGVALPAGVEPAPWVSAGVSLPAGVEPAGGSVGVPAPVEPSPWASAGVAVPAGVEPAGGSVCVPVVFTSTVPGTTLAEESGTQSVREKSCVRRPHGQTKNDNGCKPASMVPAPGLVKGWYGALSVRPEKLIKRPHGQTMADNG